MTIFNKLMPAYSLEELQLLKSFVLGSGFVTGMWVDEDFEFLESIDGLKSILILEPWRKDALMLLFDKLPLYINKDLHPSHWYTQIWNSPVIKWRLQIGK